MTLRKRLLMASVAIATLAIMLPATTAQATSPVWGVTPATTTTSTSIIANTGKFDLTLKSIALQAKWNTGQTQFEQAIATSVYFGDGTAKKVVGDKVLAKAGAAWAFTHGTVGYYGVMQATKFGKFKVVTVIDKAKHPAAEYAYMRFHSLGKGIG